MHTIAVDSCSAPLALHMDSRRSFALSRLASPGAAISPIAGLNALQQVDRTLPCVSLAKLLEAKCTIIEIIEIEMIRAEHSAPACVESPKRIAVEDAAMRQQMQTYRKLREECRLHYHIKARVSQSSGSSRRGAALFNSASLLAPEVRWACSLLICRGLHLTVPQLLDVLVRLVVADELQAAKQSGQQAADSLACWTCTRHDVDTIC